MAFEKKCEFYVYSKCILKNKYCDLNCDGLSNIVGFDIFEKFEGVKKSQREEMDEELKGIGLKWR